MFKYKFSQPLDSPERTIAHGKIIKENLFLKETYNQWYSYFLNEIHKLPEGGHLIELGSGGGFLKELLPTVICTDILELPSLDITCSALDLPFGNQSTGGIFMVDAFHHFTNCKKFLSEADRVLIPNGKLIMVEPANSFFSRPIYKYLHHEPFDPRAGWEIPESGPLSNANGALPYIVFIRDRALFIESFPNLTIESVEFIHPLLYLISGGLSRKQIFPDFSFRFFNGLDRFLSKLSPQFSMFMVIKIRKV
jgi:SAM-dependent methyltransferase